MRFSLCAGFVSGLFFSAGITIFFSDRVPLFIGVLLMVISAFFMGVLLGENDS